MFNSIEDAMQAFVTETVDALGVVREDSLREGVVAIVNERLAEADDEVVSGLIDAAFTDRGLDDFDPDNVLGVDAVRDIVLDELPSMDDYLTHDDLPDFDDFVRNGDEGLSESTLVDLMRSYAPDGCRTAQAANDLLASWFAAVLDGRFPEMHERLNEHIRFVVLAALEQPTRVERVTHVVESVPSSMVVIAANDQYDSQGYSKTRIVSVEEAATLVQTDKWRYTTPAEDTSNATV